MQRRMVRFFTYKLIRNFTVAAVLIAVIASAVHVNAQKAVVFNIGVIGAANSPTAHGVELAVERFNALNTSTTPDGKAYKLAVVTQDAGSVDDVTGAITSFKKSNVIAIFGPDDDTLAVASQTVLAQAGLPIFTAASTTALATTGLIFRTRADDKRQFNNLLDFALTDLAKSKIAIYQGSSNVAPLVTTLNTALTTHGKVAATTVVQTADGAIPDSAKALITPQPDLIVAFGTTDQVSALLTNLRAQNYTGAFAYPDAQNQDFLRSLMPGLQTGIIGVSTWSYSLTAGDSGDFIRDYVASFGEVPMPQSAAAYDSAVALFISISKAGSDPQALQRELLKLPKNPSIQGHFNAALGSNTLSADVVIFTTGEYGAPVPNAQFDETGRLPAANTTTTPTATPTRAPTATGTPINGVVGTVKSSILGVYTGPSTRFPLLGELKKGDTFQVLGVSQDATWLVLDFARRQGWVVASRVSVAGNMATIPVVAAPLPPTATRLPFADLLVTSATINPPVPAVNQPFTVTVEIKNQGVVDAGTFAVAASFEPGNVYASAIVPSLAAGATTTVNLMAAVNGAGTFKVAIVVDLNNQVNEGPYKGNNKFPFEYTIH